MKTVKLLTLCAVLIGAASFITGCACCSNCSADKKPACGMQCCADGKTTCATCPTCTPKK